MTTNVNIWYAIRDLYKEKHGEDFIGVVEGGERIGADFHNGEIIDQTYSERELPTELEIAAAAKVYQDAEDATKYQRERFEEYLDRDLDATRLVVALYDPDDKAEIDAKRAAVKAKWPKDNSGPIE